MATVDFKDRAVELPLLGLSEDDRGVETLSRRPVAKKHIDSAPCASTEETKRIATLIKAAHQQHKALTLAVVNTVERAQKLHDELGKIYTPSVTRPRRRKGSIPETTEPQGGKPELLLIHLRFRPSERKVLNQQLTLADKVCRGESIPTLSDAERLKRVHGQCSRARQPLVSAAPKTAAPLKLRLTREHRDAAIFPQLPRLRPH